MNNNTKSRNARRHKELRKSGFAKPVYRKKAKPFPLVNKGEKAEALVTLRHQRHVFHGTPCDCAVLQPK